jgi:hypothetical protein
MSAQIVDMSENSHQKEKSGTVNNIQVRSLEMKEFRKRRVQF